MGAGDRCSDKARGRIDLVIRDAARLAAAHERDLRDPQVRAAASRAEKAMRRLARLCSSDLPRGYVGAWYWELRDAWSKRRVIP